MANDNQENNFGRPLTRRNFLSVSGGFTGALLGSPLIRRTDPERTRGFGRHVHKAGTTA